MTVTTRTPPALILLACAIAFGVAFTAQYGFHLRPCALCVYQRIPYAVAAVLAALALFPMAPGPRRLLLALCAVTFFANTGIAAYHVGVEQHWWAGLDACEGAGEPLPDSPEALMEALRGPRPARCDEIPFQVLGVTMAGANVPASLALAVFSAFAASRRQRTR